MPNSFKSYAQTSIGTSNTTVVTAPGGTTTTVIGLTLANITASTDITADVWLVKGATSYYIVRGVSVPAGSTVVPIGGSQKVVLETGDFIRVSSNTAASIDAIASVLESS